MNTSNSKNNQKKIKRIILVLCIPLIFGLYKIIETQFIQLPYMLGDNNPQLVKLYHYEKLCVTDDSGPHCSRICIGYRIKDSLKVQVSFERLQVKFDSISSENLITRIDEQGMEVLTYFDVNDEGYIIPHNKESEIRELWDNIALTYGLLALPIIIFLTLIGFLRIIGKIFY